MPIEERWVELWRIAPSVSLETSILGRFNLLGRACMLEDLHQPSVQSLVERMADELGARAVVILHDSGQVVHHYGWISDSEFPTIAAMIAASKSLGQLGENFPSSPNLLSCDSDAMGIYTVAVKQEIWLAVLYEQPLNPGQFRMKVRRYAALLARIGISVPEQWEHHETNAAGRIVAPASNFAGVTMEKITVENSSLFANITDQEIDDIFAKARS
jgi:hypothetical protein